MSTQKSLLNEKWITQAQAAKLRGVSRQAINKLIKKGRIQSMKISSVVFVDRHEIVNFKATSPGRRKKENNG